MEFATLPMYAASVEFLQGKLPDHFRSPRIAVICGSGLGGLAETVKQTSKSFISFDYAAIPHFPQATGRSSGDSFLAIPLPVEDWREIVLLRVSKRQETKLKVE